MLTTVGALSEMPAQAHYGDRIKPENRDHVFPLTGDGNVARLFAEAVTAPVYLLKEIIANPGDTEKWGGLAGALFLMRKAGSGKNFAATVSKRVNLANDFYQKQGYSPTKTLDHIQGIDFSEAVQTTTLKKGTVIQQWVRDGGDVGDYFTSTSNGTAKNLGITYEGRTLKSFTLTGDVKVLKSTASDIGGNAGGGVQYFSAELNIILHRNNNMNIPKLILMIDNAFKELDAITDTIKYFQSGSKPIADTKKILSLLKQEVLSNPENINQRILRAMHDMGASSYKDFEYTSVEKALNNVTEILYNEYPGYRTLTPLGMDFGKGNPI